MEDIITLDYGSGGGKTAELIDSILLPAFKNPILSQLGDGALLKDRRGEDSFVFSTDSFVVSPWKFPGGNIGNLCVCGTVNDVCMAGGLPQYLSLSFILEEGFSFRDFKMIVDTIAEEARQAGVLITTGDTKVVEAGKGDGIYINTSGIGFLRAHFPGKSGIRKGDTVILSGSAGCHGAAVMMARSGLLPLQDTQTSSLRSDCQCLHRLTEAAIHAAEKTQTDTDAPAVSPACSGIRIMRDPTRGGVATTLNEFTENMPFSIEIEEDAVPVDAPVEAACDLLGLDPLYCACEGRMLLVTAPEACAPVLDALKEVPGGEHAAVIGTVTEDMPGHVLLKTRIGGKRILSKLSGQQLPRIC